MALKKALRRLKELIFHIVFTTHCPCCGELIEYGESVCPECRKKLIPLESPVCHKCGASLADHDPSFCPAIEAEVIGAYYYGGDVRRLIIDFKDRKSDGGFEVFREAVTDKIALEYANVDFDIAVCVPSYEKKKHLPGREMAQVISESFGFGFCDALEKYRETLKQHRLSQKERMVNLENSIRVKESEKESVKGKTILLCDDVKTTGSTLNECIKALYAAGAEKVCCVCVAVSDYTAYDRN